MKLTLKINNMEEDLPPMEDWVKVKRKHFWVRRFAKLIANYGIVYGKKDLPWS